MTGTAVILETRKPNLNSVMEAMSMLMFHRMTIGNCQIGSEIDKIKDIFQIVVNRISILIVKNRVKL